MRGSATLLAALPAAALALLAAGCVGGGGGDGPPRPRRIILVSMDTVRADRVSGYGGANTPHLARMAAQGALLPRFYASSSFTLPATMTMLTGLDPVEHGVLRGPARLSPEVPTLAEGLAAAGYRTRAYHEGGFVAARFGFARGFEDYLERPRLAVFGEALPEVLDWMRAAGESPYFLFLHSYAAHYPWGGLKRYRAEHPERGLPSDEEVEALRRRYPPPEEGGPPRQPSNSERALCTLLNHFAERRKDKLECGANVFSPAFRESPHFAMDVAAMLASYDERIRGVDRALGRIRALLERLGEWDDTLLMVTSDHGEAFFEHGLEKHGFVPFDEVLRVPLVISYPRLLRHAPRRRVPGLAGHLDLVPTLLRLAGAPIPASCRGRDLTGALLGHEALPAGRALFPAVLRLPHRSREPLRRAVLRGPLKLIEGHERFGDPDGLLFDLRADAAERSNLLSTRPAAANRLRTSLARHRRALRPVTPVHQRTRRPLTPAEAESDDRLDPAEREKLEALGYLG